MLRLSRSSAVMTCSLRVPITELCWPLTLDERAPLLAALDDPLEGLTELRGVLMNEHQWRQRTGLDA